MTHWCLEYAQTPLLRYCILSDLCRGKLWRSSGTCRACQNPTPLGNASQLTYQFHIRHMCLRDTCGAPENIVAHRVCVCYPVRDSAEVGTLLPDPTPKHWPSPIARLSQVRTGHRIQLELPSGKQRNYRVRATRIVDSSKELLPRKSDFEGLLLVTCYPFDALRSTGPLRYLVDAEPVRLLPESLSLGSQEVGYAL